MLVGNKCDLDNIRAVSVEDGKNLAEKHRLFFMKTSALDSTNVKTAFEMVIKKIYNNCRVGDIPLINEEKGIMGQIKLKTHK
nr:Ras-related protein RABA5c-like [Tanacetum cinerariifolium]